VGAPIFTSDGQGRTPDLPVYVANPTCPEQQRRSPSQSSRIPPGRSFIAFPGGSMETASIESSPREPSPPQKSRCLSRRPCRPTPFFAPPPPVSPTSSSTMRRPPFVAWPTSPASYRSTSTKPSPTTASPRASITS